MRRAARIDSTHRVLFDLAWTLGGYVLYTHQLGRGYPDGMVSIPGREGWLAVEVKADKGKLRPAQIKLHERAPVVVWRTEADVLKSFRVKESR